MKIRYNQKGVPNNLIFGSLIAVIGIAAVLKDSSSIFNYLQIVLGLLLAVSSLYKKRYQYVTITHKTLTKHSVLPKTKELSDIKRVGNYLNTYKIETDKTTIKIDKEIITSESLVALDEFIKNLDVKVERQ